MDVLATATAAIEATRKLMQLGEVQRHADLKLNIADLSVQLAELKLEVAGLLEKNHTLEQQVKKLSQPAGGLVVKDGMYFTESGDGPFCTGCFDAKGQKVRVSETASALHIIGRYRCPACKANYK